ncbi:MAG: beta-glucosidase BglX [Opitutaceae bacterium]|nr:beta-glucosidase BglX [Opitutaceae bacterium]
MLLPRLAPPAPHPLRRRFQFAALAFAVWSACAAAAPLQSALVADAEVDRRVETLLAQMTLAEKIGQLTQIGPNPVAPENLAPEDLIRNGQVGSVLWTVDVAVIKRLQQIAVKESRLRIPLLFGFDVIHGYANTFPVPLAMASSWDPAMVERAQAIAAKEASVSGINWTFGPMVDIARDARWGRIVEGAGEDPFLGAAMARAQVLGFQGPKLGTPGRIVGSVKHFAGYGAAEGGRDYDSCYLSDGTFRNVCLPPFQAAIDAGVGTVMSAYMCLNDVPASGNVWLMRDILRGELGFRGFVISDAWAVHALAVHGLARDQEDAARRGLLAGVSMDMGSMTYHKHAEKLVTNGKIPLTVVDALVREILSVKIRLGLFESPYGDPDKKAAVCGAPAHRAATREAAQRSMVLLRNEAGALPLAKTLRSVAVLGPLGASVDDIKGSWAVEGGPAVSVLEGIRAKLPGASVEFARGGDMQRAYPMPWEAREGKKAPAGLSAGEMQQELERAVALARRSELVVLVLGERANMSGEAASASTLALQGNQQLLLEAVVATGKPVVLVLLSGRPLDITWAAARVPAILQAWFPGTEGGNAVADLLFGDVNPGAKLPVTWPRSTGHCPQYYNHPATHSREDDEFFTSRFADTTSAPLYPFGYGLSYTTFAYSDLALDKTTLKDGQSLQVAVAVQNTGKVAGDEVVQLYLHQKAGSTARPVRELKGFERLHLAPGEKRTVTFTLSRAELQYWSQATRSWVLESESFDVWVGGDSRATLQGSFTIVE